jgi:uncharacterized protein (TIGR00299 family) protein
MLLGAALDAGADLEAVRAAVAAVGVEPIALTTEHVQRGGFAALRAHVGVDPRPAARAWGDIRALLAAAPLDERVRERAVATFERLAHAEAGVHGTAPDRVHFHELGALDSIADVVGACAALVDLGIDDLACSAVALGSGTVLTSHGAMAVPGPAVVALLASAGAPTHAGQAPWEACTPTGAALLATWVTRWGPQPSMTVSSAGSGAGGRGGDDDSSLLEARTAGRPLPPANVLRLVVGVPASAAPTASGPSTTSTATLVETNVDDLDPRLWPHVVTRLIAAGASDAWLTPIVMKKGRAAHTLHVLAADERVDDVVRTVLVETTAIGVRLTQVGKRALEREQVGVDVGGARVRIKVARLDGAVVNAQPELDDVLAAAESLGLPAKVVLARAVAAAESAGIAP